MAIALDGSATNNTSTTSVAVNLTTTQVNDYIIVAVGSNGGPVVSVVSAALGAFTLMSRKFISGVKYEEVWFNFSPGVLTADTITVTQTSAAFIIVDAFAVSGSGQTSAVFDSGGPQTAAGDPISITTVSQNTMAVACFTSGSVSTLTAGSGMTLIRGVGFLASEYKILSSAQTLSCTLGTGVGTGNAAIAFAIVQTGAPIPLPPQTMVMM